MNGRQPILLLHPAELGCASSMALESHEPTQLAFVVGATLTRWCHPAAGLYARQMLRLVRVTFSRQAASTASASASAMAPAPNLRRARRDAQSARRGPSPHGPRGAVRRAPARIRHARAKRVEREPAGFSVVWQNRGALHAEQVRVQPGGGRPALGCGGGRARSRDWCGRWRRRLLQRPVRIRSRPLRRRLAAPAELIMARRVPGPWRWP
jgi:hypothetical protein